jgi:hypothetical protein
MSTVIRSLVEKSIQVMEAGRFQDFCLEFLPFFSERYKGLERHGHTGEGKTRKGTPDLIKTEVTGEQIAVQCGTEENYWRRPTQEDEWKPFSDAKKCLAELSSPSEIVLISSREIPTNQSNTKSDLIGLINKETAILVNAVTLGEIGQFIVENLHDPRGKALVEKYCPDAYLAFRN